MTDPVLKHRRSANVICVEHDDDALNLLLTRTPAEKAMQLTSTIAGTVFWTRLRD